MGQAILLPSVQGLQGLNKFADSLVGPPVASWAVDDGARMMCSEFPSLNSASLVVKLALCLMFPMPTTKGSDLSETNWHAYSTPRQWFRFKLGLFRVFHKWIMMRFASNLCFRIPYIPFWQAAGVWPGPCHLPLVLEAVQAPDSQLDPLGSPSSPDPVESSSSSPSKCETSHLPALAPLQDAPACSDRWLKPLSTLDVHCFGFPSSLDLLN